ncbi:CENP-A multicopy suppressor protein 2 [Wickerhamomyces ciferrii]|uniref:CENP-A multicopy suppressor protein 2 n=1 Tax=Wickerhamomyces ciferrii (strain ATCC 14091 / BCRC 22168 / CBS 111 / JCM 3599 / NBRC 0793 / NRRL Y-1031 F-60-10) TaxID=1206466 RepID=K0KSW7_WICCF|nr:CENP-A multicopy suppressor protein 2 [Wickerhamomyces ciferrii]CCH44428.1 CENP-A multicopy suppressor protein 2 [Wickerhamomyces ciferrii]
MRACHMPSLPEMPFEHHEDQNQGQFRRMKLKILYTLEDNTFLARSSNILNVKTLTMPIPGQRNLMTLGVVSLKEVLQPIQKSSPELFVDDSIDYSVYVKDITEEDEPFVGYGLFHKILLGQQQDTMDFDDDETLIPGRVCSNFAALLSKNSSETLEIKLRLARVVSKRSNNNNNQPQQQQQQQQQSQQQQQLQPSQQQRQSQGQIPQQQSIGSKRKNDEIYNQSPNNVNSSTSPVYPELSTFQIPQQKPQIYDHSSTKKSKQMASSSSTNSAVKASRTQSLPAFNQPLNQLHSSHLASMGYFPPSAKVFPASTIAGQIRQADEIKQHRTNYSFQVDGLDGNVTKPITVAPSNRFAPNFISSDNKKFNSKESKSNSSTTKKSRSKKQTKSNTTKTQSKNQTQSNSIKSSPAAPTLSTFKEIPKNIPECFNCQTVSAPVWRYFDTEEESKRGMYCNTCYIYLLDKGSQRPKNYYNNSNNNNELKPSSAKYTKKDSKDLNNSSNNPQQQQQQLDNGPKLHSMKHEQTSSDPVEEFQDMVSSDLDFNFGPMTDIDPLPQQKRTPQILNTEDKENIPPISIQKLSRQNSFEKMLIKSFSGVPPNMNNINSTTPNNEWLNEFFEPTPKDQDQQDSSITPKDFDNTPRDLATCNTLPCEDDTPPSQPLPQVNESNNGLNHKDSNSIDQKESNLKVSMMPSSPFNLNTQDVNTSSPETVDHTSDWLSEHTKLSSMDNEEQVSK